MIHTILKITDRMVINFREIPLGNTGHGDQDQFEQFACDFLETIGFEILRRPDRGADGGKDIIVKETRLGIGGKSTIQWLVSCKHHAHSGKSVSPQDEINIIERLAQHECQAFMGIYSTIPSSGLSDRLHKLKPNIETNTYDGTRLEREILSLKSNQKSRILTSYFPNSYEKLRELDQNESKQEVKQQGQFTCNFTKEDILQITKTAIILLDIEKLKEKYYNHNWSDTKILIGKFYRFENHYTEKVALEIFSLMLSISNRTRYEMPSDIAFSMESLVFTFFPASYDDDENERLINGKLCISIGSNLVYNGLIYRNNLSIAIHGLSILKFIYKKGKERNMPQLTQKVLNTYKELEHQFNRPDRNDLDNGKKLVQIFKADLNNSSLSLPILPNYLFDLINK